MCPRCCLLMMLLLETRAWGSGEAPECPGCRDVGQATACPPQGACKSPPGAEPPCREHACPRALGEPCGVYTPSCARGLRCLARADEKTPLQALLQGRGVCKRVAQRGAVGNHTEHHPGEGHRKKGSQTALHPLVPHNQTTRNSSQDNLHPPAANGNNKDLLHPLPNGDKDPFYRPALNEEDTRQGSEVVAPCQLHLTSVMQELRSSLFTNAKDMYIPNCDKGGFYRRKQCKSSKGHRRGQCWCVDKRGHPLPGLEGLKGNTNCPAGAN